MPSFEWSKWLHSSSSLGFRWPHDRILYSDPKRRSQHMMAQHPWPSLQRRAMLRISAVKKDSRIFLGLAQASCGHGGVTFECVVTWKSLVCYPGVSLHFYEWVPTRARRFPFGLGCSNGAWDFTGGGKVWTVESIRVSFFPSFFRCLCRVGIKPEVKHWFIGWTLHSWFSTDSQLVAICILQILHRSQPFGLRGEWRGCNAGLRCCEERAQGLCSFVATGRCWSLQGSRERLWRVRIPFEEIVVITPWKLYNPRTQIHLAFCWHFVLILCWNSAWNSFKAVEATKRGQMPLFAAAQVPALDEWADCFAQMSVIT